MSQASVAPTKENISAVVITAVHELRPLIEVLATKLEDERRSREKEVGFLQLVCVSHVLVRLNCFQHKYISTSIERLLVANNVTIISVHCFSDLLILRPLYSSVYR